MALVRIQKPTPGRVVLYRAAFFGVFPAIVINNTKNDPLVVQLQVLGNFDPEVVSRFPTCKYSAVGTPESSSWCYPPRCDETIEVEDGINPND